MQKRNRANGHNDEWKIRIKKLFEKKDGRLRFDLLRRFHYWWLGGRSLTRNIFRITAAKQGVMLIGSILIALFIMAAFYTQSGEFVVRVDHPGEKWLVLSETTDFSEELIALSGTAIPSADNISIFDLAPDVAEVDGDHNGVDYVAYTFYVKNIGYDPITYNYSLNIQRQTKGIDEAVWIMLYHNGEQQILAKESQSGGAESQSSEYEFPFKEAAKDKGQYTYDEKTGIHTLTTIPFASSKVVATADRPEIQPQEYDKFTVVIWLEGEDPECINDILGGSIEMMMKFRY